MPHNEDGNWLEPTWEYTNFHPALDEEHKDRWRIWEEGGEIVAFVHYEWRMGEVLKIKNPGSCPGSFFFRKAAQPNDLRRLQFE